jgi:hypothetical protein
MSKKMEVLCGLARRMVNASGLNFPVELTTDREQALEGMDLSLPKSAWEVWPHESWMKKSPRSMV